MATPTNPAAGQAQPAADALAPTAYGQAAKFRFHGVDPPALVYITLNDVLLLRVFDPFSFGPTIIVSGRILRPDGQIIPFSQQFITTGGAAPVDFTITTGEGFLVSVAAGHQTTGTPPGEVYCALLLKYGNSPQGFLTTQLVEGYLRNNFLIAWPNGVNEIQGSGPGNHTQLTNLAPAAGADISVAVPTGSYIRIYALEAALTTSAAAANRVVSLVITRFGTEQFRITMPVAQTASLTQTYVWFAGGPSPVQNTIGTQTRNFAGLPAGLTVDDNLTLATSTDNIQAADQWTSLKTLCEVWVQNF